MIVNVADTTATERPLRHLNRSEHRVVAMFTTQTVLQLVPQVLLLSALVNPDTDDTSTVIMTE